MLAKTYYKISRHKPNLQFEKNAVTLMLSLLLPQCIMREMYENTFLIHIVRLEYRSVI